MKKGILLIVALLLCSVAQTASADGLTAWIYSGVDYDSPDNSIGARGGLEIGPVEVGIQSIWSPTKHETKQRLDAYGLIQLGKIYEVVPYIGGQVLDVEDLDNDTQIIPMVGVIAFEIVAVEYQYHDYLDDPHRVVVGARFKF